MVVGVLGDAVLLGEATDFGDIGLDVVDGSLLDPRLEVVSTSQLAIGRRAFSVRRT